MDTLILILKIVVAVSILNVWLVQNKKPTRWRGGNAQTIIEEFKVYGLPEWMCYTVGTLKVLFAVGLIVSIWVESVTNISAIGLGTLLTGSVLMHVKINDPLYKSFPALLFLAMCITIVLV